MPTEIETKALEAACEKATDKLEIDWDGDEPFVRSDSIETAVEAAIRAYLAALDSPIGEQGVGVKALEWRCVGNGIWEAGHHQVWHQWASDGLWYSSVNVGHRKVERIGDGFKSLEAAQSACQADFTRRIISALSPERKEPVAWMRKWAFDGETPYRETNPRTGRQHLARKFTFHEVSRNRLFPDDVPLAATPEQPT